MLVQDLNGDKKETHESDNSSAEVKDDICFNNACDSDNLNWNTSDLDDDDNKDTIHYESICEYDSVTGRNDDWLSFTLSVIMLFVLIL